jgi:type I restriction enzyme R subunit
VAWLYKHDPSLKLPYQDNLSALFHEPTFKALAGEAIFNKTRIIARLGNQAVHSLRPVPPTDALAAVWCAVSATLGHPHGPGANAADSGCADG